MHASAASLPAVVSPVRISAWATTLGLHAAVFALLLAPPVPLELPLKIEPRALTVIDVPEVVVEPVPVPPPPNPPIRPARPHVPSPAPVEVHLVDSALPVPMAMPDIEPTLEASTDAFAPAADVGARIAYGEAPPPPYPGIAMRRGWQGEVLLRVKVGADGRALEAVVERSSGHRLLDRVASAHVLARWRFQAAQQGGRLVEAWALVPISFKLERL
jgi:periplasmic protein TonB